MITAVSTATIAPATVHVSAAPISSANVPVTAIGALTVSTAPRADVDAETRRPVLVIVA